MIKIIEGNIVDAQTDYIIHQVNCQGEMNTGVAKALRDYDEGIYIHYRNVCKLREFNPELLLGTYDEYFIRRKNQEILSLFAQDKYGYDGKQYTDVKAFREGLNFIRQQIPVYWFDADNRPHKTTIALSYKIGCGRGGADWEVVYKIIEEELSSFEVELWKLEEQNV